MEEIKVGVEEKKKTQGMRRDLGHICGVFIHHFFSSAASAAFYAIMGENWKAGMRRKIRWLLTLMAVIGCTNTSLKNETIL